MKKIASLLVLVSLFSNLAFGADNCDWSKIKKLPDGGYEYSLELNECVGRLVQENKVKDQQITDLTKAIQLKDLAIKDSDERANMWLTTSTREQERIVKIDADQKTSNLIYFGLGVALTVLSVWGASKAIGH